MSTTYTRYAINTLPYLVIGIVSYVLSLHTYPDYINDDRLDKHPFYYTMIWSGTVLLPTAWVMLYSIGIVIIDWDTTHELTLLAQLCTWIWGWIIIADSDTWDIMRSEYYGIYVLSILYQVFTLFISVIDVSSTSHNIDSIFFHSVSVIGLHYRVK